VKTHDVLLDGNPDSEGIVKELVANRLNKLGNEAAMKDAAYKELVQQTIKAGNALLSALNLPDQQARRLFDAYEMAVINQNDYILEKAYMQAFRDGIEFCKALKMDPAPIK
jgi:hypothetical protein